MDKVNDSKKFDFERLENLMIKPVAVKKETKPNDETSAISKTSVSLFSSSEKDKPAPKKSKTEAMVN